MIKKILLIFSFITLITITFSGTTYAANTLAVGEELSKLNELYKEGVITEEEFKKAKSILLDPEAAKTVTKRKKKEKKKKLTALERRQLKEAEAEEKIALKAQKAQLREEKKEEKKNKPKWGQAESQTKYRTLVDLFKRD